MTPDRQEALRLARHARASLDLIGEGDWTPQDSLLSRAADALDALAADLEAAEREIAELTVRVQEGWDAEVERTTRLIDDERKGMDKLKRDLATAREALEALTKGRADVGIHVPPPVRGFARTALRSLGEKDA